MAQPDLRTKEGASDFMNYKAPTPERALKHEKVNDNFVSLLQYLWDDLPDGPGKTRFIHSLKRAQMEANSCIANEGA